MALQFVDTSSRVSLHEEQMASCSSSTNGESKNHAWISLGDQPNQTTLFTFPKRAFGLKILIYRSFQSSWFKKWPWLYSNQVNDKASVSRASRLQRWEFYLEVHTAGQTMPLWFIAIPPGKTPADTRKVGFLCMSGSTFTDIVQTYSLDHTVILSRWYPLSAKKKQSIVHTLEKSCGM